MGQVVIVGAGQAGHCAAFELRRQGYEGRIILIGEEAYAPYERPPLSKAVLVASEPPAPVFFSSSDRYREHDIELMLSHHVEAIDRDGKLYLTGGKQLAYDRLLLATGGRARTLEIDGNQHVAYLRTWEDAQTIRARLKSGQRLLCIGAGVIGLEIAASASTMGCMVSVLEAGTMIMGRCLAAAQAEYLLQRHKDAGIDFHFGKSLKMIKKVPDGFVVTFASGEELVVDLIVAGIGMARQTRLAEDAGLDVDNGIIVDLHARTSDDAIFAAGDATAFYHACYPERLRLETWYHAQYHGACAGRALAGKPRAYDDIPRFWTDQHDLNIQVAGFPVLAMSDIVVGDPLSKSFTALHADEQGRLIGATAVNQPRSMRPVIEAIRRGGKADPGLLELRRPVATLSAHNHMPNRQWTS